MIDSQIFWGLIVDLIIDFVCCNWYDFILMGIQGVLGLQEIFFGSIINVVLKQVDILVFVVFVGYRYILVEKIVLAIDEEGLEDCEMVKLLLVIFKVFDVLVCVFY